MDALWIQCLVLLFCLHMTAAPKPGEACTGEGQCEGNSLCTSPDVGATCDCRQGFLRYTDRCVSNADICAPSFDRVSIKSGTKNFVMDCVDVSVADTVVWSMSLDGGNQVTLGSCPPRPGNCTQNQPPRFTVTRPTDSSSQLTIADPKALLNAGDGVVISCTPSTHRPRLLDMFEEGPVSITPANLNQEKDGNWVMTGGISITNVTSLHNCYGCIWQEVNQETKAVFRIPDDMTTFELSSVGNSNIHNLKCSFRNPRLPKDSGHYRYRVYLLHRGLPHVDINPVFQIRHPPPPVHNCPAIVAEGDSVQCECIVRDRGLPKRRFSWAGQTSGLQLTVPTVGRQQHGTEFTCSEQSGVKVTYTLRVAYGPSKVYIATTEKIDADLSLVCIPLDVYPTPSFTWRNADTGKVISKGQKLKVKASDLSEVKEIECEAMNYENKGKVATASISTDMLDTTQFNVSLVNQRPLTSSDDNGIVIGFVIGFFVMLLVVLVLAGVLVYLHYRRRKSRKLEGLGKQEAHGEESSVNFVDILDRQRSETATTDRVDNCETVTLEERGFPEGSSNYDALDQQAVAQPSPYDSLHVDPTTASKSGPRELRTKPPFYHQDSGPLYANRQEVLDSPIYANTPPSSKDLK